jgi:hypothetical protein
MDTSQVAYLEADSHKTEGLLLSDRAFDTDPSKILIESSDPQKLRFRPIEWLAEAPNRKVKAERKKKISETLDISTRQVERLLDRYNDDRLHETVGIERMDTQDLSLDGLKQLNKLRSTGKRQHSNYDALMALDKRQKLVEERKHEKKERQRSGQKELRGKSKENSNVVEMRKIRAGKSARNKEPMELLPERVTSEQMKPQQPVLPPAPITESDSTTPRILEGEDKPKTERHRLVIPNNQTLKRIW